IARRGRQAAELHCGAVAADRLDPDCLLVGKDAGEAVEVWQTLAIEIRVALAAYRLAGLVAGRFERAGPQDILLVPVRILIEVRLLGDEGERVGEGRQKR